MESLDASPLPIRPVVPAPGSVPLELLRRMPYFSGLEIHELAAVAELMHPLSFNAGDFVFRQGTAPDGIYVLESGQVQMWTRIGDFRQDLVHFEAGAPLCLASVVETGGRIASMEVTKPSRVWLLDLRAFDGLVHQKHPIAFRILKVAAEESSRGFSGALALMRKHTGFAPSAPAPADALPPERSTTASDASLLNALPFAKSLLPDDRDTLCRIARWRDVKRGHRLFAEGGAVTPLQFVVRGALEAIVEPPSGKQRMSMRGPGRLVGHESCMANVPQPYSVVARENTTLLGIERVELEQLFAARHALSLRLLQEIAGALTEQFDRDMTSLLRAAVARGVQTSISSDEIAGLAPRPSM